jgi:hypothetical protein
MPVLFCLRLLCHELVVMTCACNSVHMQPRLSNPVDVHNHSACVQLFIRKDSPVCGGLSFSFCSATRGVKVVRIGVLG